MDHIRGKFQHLRAPSAPRRVDSRTTSSGSEGEQVVHVERRPGHRRGHRDRRRAGAGSRARPRVGHSRGLRTQMSTTSPPTRYEPKDP
ncbi:MAG: hypothetical protein AVDCRST_MAG06-1582 [uncultured Nocardioides sp.]|uniref:Uncharacterized protein n=1 Tax=uncultured Nocardioides sp. TaxID=198441 RepID=A0A6J4NPE7_9ACTN|nr:MAG: hypothetical protein AVDCRST_MAG06-1582 [uncultured Nocardioides sp.]